MSTRVETGSRAPVGQTRCEYRVGQALAIGLFACWTGLASAFVLNDNSPRVLEAARRVQIEGASPADPLAEAAAEFLALSCACRAADNWIRVTNEELAEIGVTGRFRDGTVYCGGARRERGGNSDYWPYIDFGRSGITILNYPDLEQRHKGLIETLAMQRARPVNETIRRAAILRIFVRVATGEEYPIELPLVETNTGEYVYYPVFSHSMPPDTGLPIPSAALPPEILAESARLVDDPRPNPPTTRPRPPGPALDSEFQRRGSLGKWLGAAGILVLGVGGLMAGRKILGGG